MNPQFPVFLLFIVGTRIILCICDKKSFKPDLSMHNGQVHMVLHSLGYWECSSLVENFPYDVIGVRNLSPVVMIALRKFPPQKEVKWVPLLESEHKYSQQILVHIQTYLQGRTDSSRKVLPSLPNLHAQSTQENKVGKVPSVDFGDDAEMTGESNEDEEDEDGGAARKKQKLVHSA